MHEMSTPRLSLRSARSACILSRMPDERPCAVQTCASAVRILVLTVRSAMVSTTTSNLRLTGTRPGGRQKHMLQQLRIDPEFESKIQPLRDEDFRHLYD